MTNECDPEYHRIDTYRILREQGMADAGLAKRMAIFTASECAEVAKKYQARIEELEAAQDWQPIETAPKDGTMVFVWFPDVPKAFLCDYESRIKLGRFVADLQEWSVQGVISNMPLVTHWRPLFDAPKGTDDD